MDSMTLSPQNPDDAGKIKNAIEDSVNMLKGLLAFAALAPAQPGQPAMPATLTGDLNSLTFAIEGANVTGNMKVSAQTVEGLAKLGAQKNFMGGGPTVSTQARWAPGGSNLAFFSSARGSLLVGRSRQAFLFTDVITDPSGLIGNSSLSSSFSDRRDLTDCLGVLEVGVDGRDDDARLDCDEVDSDE